MENIKSNSKTENTENTNKNNSNAPKAAVLSFDAMWQAYLRKFLYLNTKDDPKPTYDYDIGKIDYFGILNIVDIKSPERKLWYFYYCKNENLNDTLKRLRSKFGKKQTWEIYREHTYSGVDLYCSVKQYFKERKFYIKENVFEAPKHEKRYTNERIIKAVTELHNYERQKFYNHLLVMHNW